MQKFEMAGITRKPAIYRHATAAGELKLKPATIMRIRKGRIQKGEPLPAAEVAAALAAKKTHELIPFCHPLPIEKIDTSYSLGKSLLRVEASVRATAKTGVEMEALVAATTFLLTVWDMVKQYEKDRNGQYPYTAINSVVVKKKIKGR